ncbi:MAG: hypothetical protein F4137_23340 [Acidobacteria bacterium]|nr:hypothetical protein [Acidobacteriota bacterium]
MPAAVQPVELVWKLEAGTDLVYRESQQVEIEMPGATGPVTLLRSGSTERWSVLQVDGDGNATVRMTTEEAYMNFDGPMGSISADPADQGGSGAFLDGISFTVVLDPRGVVVEMSGLEEMREALRAELRDLPVPPLLDGMLGDHVLDSQSAQGPLVMPLPTGPVGVGSTWDSDFALPIPGFGSITGATSYRIESLDGDVVVIGSSGTLSLPDGAASLLVPVQFSDPTIVGSSRFDAGKGLLLGMESTMRAEIAVAVAEREFVVEVAMTTTLEFIEGGE